MEAQDKFIANIIELIDSVTPEQYENYIKDSYVARPEMPYNPFSAHYYRGINQFYFGLLNLFGVKKSNFFGTFKQISEAGGKIKKGSKSLDVLFFNYRFWDRENQCSINPNDIPYLSAEEKKNIAMFPNVKVFKVFSFDDIEDVSKLDVKYPDYDTEYTNDVVIDQNIEEFVLKTGCKIVHKKVSVASYSPYFDKITMPEMEAFKNNSHYYATLFHEMIHSTASKVGRKLSQETEKYAFEELVAEAGAILLSYEFGTVGEVLNSCAYFKGYFSKFDNSKEILLNAFKDGSKASNYLLRTAKDYQEETAA